MGAMSNIAAAVDGYDLTDEQAIDAVSERVERVKREDRLLSEVLTKISMDEYNQYRNRGIPLEEIHESVCRVQEKGESFEPDPPGGPWPDPVPFDTVAIPPFPVDKLPPPLDELTKAMAESFQVDPAMPGALALGVLAGLFQGKFKLHVKPGFTTELSLYTCAAAAPGERKSPVLTYLTAPIRRYEMARNEQEAPEIQRNQQRRKILEGRQKEYETQLSRDKIPVKKKREEVETALEEVNQELDSFEDKHAFQVTADDSTNEALIDLLDKHGAILITSDEPGLFTALKGRYDKNSVYDVYLKAIDGSAIRVNRIGRASNFVPHPHLSLSLAAQPAAVRDFVNNGEFAGRGLCARFLWVDCKSNAGFRRWNTEEIPSVVALRYEQLIDNALDFEPDEPLLLRFSEEGQREAARFGAEAERELKDDGRLAFSLDWGNKFPGYVFRLAALFHLCAALSNGQDMTAPVGAEWLEAAETVGWCLVQHTKRIYAQAGADPEVEDAKYILWRLKETGAPELSERELQRKCPRFKRKEELWGPLKLLEERDYIRRERVQSEGPGRPPSDLILVNPAVFET